MPGSVVYELDDVDLNSGPICPFSKFFEIQPIPRFSFRFLRYLLHFLHFRWGGLLASACCLFFISIPNKIHPFSLSLLIKLEL